MLGLIARARSLWRGIRRTDDVDVEMDEEFRHHMELRAADLVKSGIAPDEARRKARLEFGSTESYKDKGRESRGLRRFDDLRVSWLDFKLGFRMLARYPGLTLVGGFAIAFAIWVGAGTFEFLSQVVSPRLPFVEGDRIVALRIRDAETNRVEHRASHDFVTWREELESIEELGAYRALQRNLIIGETRGEPVEVAEISASAFTLTRVPALMGRTLRAEDEHLGAPAVVVIGYDVWQSTFDGDPNVVGRTVRLGQTPITVVGVMPEDFAFPVAHNVWMPLQLNVLDYERREGPSIRIFGRLTRGATIEQAQVELNSLGQRAATDFPQTHRHLRPQVMPYAKSILSIPGWASVGLLSANLFVVMLLVLICSNVALLMFARAATRESEIVVRSALGASRGRIITQLFAEALVLGAIAAIAGLVVASRGLEWGLAIAEGQFMDGGGQLPFWFRGSLSAPTIVYSILLTVLAAVVAGVVPALKITRGIGARLKEVTAGGGGPRFGGIWTAIIVTQIAVTVAFPVIPLMTRGDAMQLRDQDMGFPVQEYLGARLELDREAWAAASPDTTRKAFLAHYAVVQRELEQRLAAEPRFAGVTFADVLPRMYHGWNQIEVEQGTVPPLDERGHRVSSAAIDVNYFDVLRTPVLSGRAFHAGDTVAGVRVAIVNQRFVDRVLGGRNPIGNRLRYVSGESSRVPGKEPAPWYEIVGVARDIGMTSGYGRAGIYHPLTRGATYPVHLALHVRGGDAESFAPRFRAAAIAVDPALQLHALMPLDDIINVEMDFYAFWFRLTTVLSAIALLLSLSGIYAVMAFAVSRRTREIGIRIALGSDRRHIVAAVFKKPLRQVAIGILAGAVLVTGLIAAAVGGIPSASQIAVILAYAALMTAVCMVACIVPTRRALRVQPTEALRAD